MNREKLKSYGKIVIERIILRSVYSKFATGLVVLGVGLLVPDFREFIFNRLIDFVNWLFTAANIPPYVAEDSVWPVVVGIGLIVVGVTVFAIGWRIDHKKKQEQEIADAQPAIDVFSERSWIYLVSGDKNEDDPKISTSVNILIEAGSKPLKLKKIEFHRYVDGCIMWGIKPTLERAATNETIEFDGSQETLMEPYTVAAESQARLFLKKEFRGPTMRFRFYQMERGDLEIVLTYSLGNSGEAETRTYLFRQDGGSLTPIESISKPHILNDNVLAEALEANIITQEEHDAIVKVKESRRHLYIRDGDDFLSGQPELRVQTELLKLLEDVNRRVWEMRDLQASSSSD